MYAMLLSQDEKEKIWQTHIENILKNKSMEGENH